MPMRVPDIDKYPSCVRICKLPYYHICRFLILMPFGEIPQALVRADVCFTESRNVN